MRRICLVIPYFGRWPRYFNIYLETCRYNPSVDWLFFTNDSFPKNLSENIKFFEMNLDDFNVLASRKLGLKVNLKKEFVYKLVDFKPAYGVIFEDYLKTFDFWGYSDIDMIYGDIRRFITDQMLDTYDVITAKKAYLVGHFTIYRNCDKINRLYRQTADYKRVFRYTQNCYSFSECAGEWDYLFRGGSIFDKKPLKQRILNFILRNLNRVCELLGGRGPFLAKREVESMTECVKRLEKNGYLKSFFGSMEKGFGSELQLDDSWKFCWQKGKLTEMKAGEEVMYFHLWKIWRYEKFIIPQWHVIPAQFFITKEGFVEE